MIRSLWTAASGMIAQQMNIDVTSNNLANVNTTGFKKSRAEFEDLMYQTHRVAGAENVSGIRLTRAGNFKPDNEGRIVTSNGYPLDPEFIIPQETQHVVITEQGHISALDKEGNELAGIDIPLYTFINPAGLNSAGRNLYKQTLGSGEAVQGVPGENNVGTIAQASLEMSNVELVEEMVNMIVGQRAYEVNSKAITTSDSMLQLANQMKR